MSKTSFPIAFVTVSAEHRGFFQQYPVIDKDLEFLVEEDAPGYGEDDIVSVLKLRALLLVMGLQASGVICPYTEVSVTVGDQTWDHEDSPEGTTLSRAFEVALSDDHDRQIQVSGEVFSGGLYLSPLPKECHEYVTGRYNEV